MQKNLEKELKKRIGIEYSLRLINESLSPEYPKGCVFTFNRLLKPSNGELGCICFLYRNPHTKKTKRIITVGKIFYDGDKIRIHVTNPDFKDSFVSKKYVLYIHRAVECKITITKSYI